jgi:hypothetical protein
MMKVTRGVEFDRIENVKDPVKARAVNRER